MKYEYTESEGIIPHFSTIKNIVCGRRDLLKVRYPSLEYFFIDTDVLTEPYIPNKNRMQDYSFNSKKNYSDIWRYNDHNKKREQYFKNRKSWPKWKKDLLFQSKQNLKQDSDFARMVNKAISLRTKSVRSKYFGIPSPFLVAGKSDKFKLIRQRKEIRKGLTIGVDVGMSCGNKSNAIIPIYENLLKFITVFELLGINYQIVYISSLSGNMTPDFAFFEVPIKNFKQAPNMQKLAVIGEIGMFRHNMFNAFIKHLPGIGMGLGRPMYSTERREAITDYDLFLSTENPGDFNLLITKILKKW